VGTRQTGLGSAEAAFRIEEEARENFAACQRLNQILWVRVHVRAEGSLLLGFYYLKELDLKMYILPTVKSIKMDLKIYIIP
jgi:hypothetical protein